MTVFEIIIICIVAALFVATIFMFTVCISNIKQVHATNKQVVTLTNAIFECRSFLEKLSKHDTIVKINNIGGLEKKVGELLTICRNQTNNITQVGDNLNKVLEDIKMRNNLIKDNHKLLDTINSKFVKIQNNANTIEEFGESTTYIKEKVGEVSVDFEKEIIKINDKLEDILSRTKRCNSGVSALIEAHNKNIDTTRESFKTIDDKISDICPNINKNIFISYEDIKEKLLKINQQYTVISNSINATSEFIKTINDELNNFSDSIDNVIKNNKINNEDIAKISSILNTYREKVNYITTWIENATKLKTATKTKSIQTKTTTTPIIKK